MSKVYEALQHAHAERHRVVHVEEPATPEVQMPEIPISRRLPPLQMEREMGRLHQSVAALLPDSKKSVIQFIGSRKDEGTSTILREFGRYLAEKLGKSVLLVDGDCFQMSQHLAFGITPKISLQHILSEGGSVDNAISQIQISRVFLCRLSRDAVPNLQPEFFVIDGEIWNQLRKQFAFILIDSPPISTSDEALALCSAVDGVILVVEAEKTRAQVVSNMKERVIQSGGNILGLVFNKERHYIPEWIYKRL